MGGKLYKKPTKPISAQRSRSHPALKGMKGFPSIASPQSLSKGEDRGENVQPRGEECLVQQNQGWLWPFILGRELPPPGPCHIWSWPSPRPDRGFKGAQNSYWETNTVTLKMCFPRRIFWANSLISTSASRTAGPRTERVSTSSPVCWSERWTASLPWLLPPRRVKRRLSPRERLVDILKRTQGTEWLDWRGK
ncbi:hypothetical protein E2320_001002 [Naja naja]|nr:hypothetical protein E2320_001002 [Naja naja]